MASVQASEAECCFHDKCGENIELSKDKKTAKRKDGCQDGYGIGISQKPMERNKMYEITVKAKKPLDSPPKKGSELGEDSSPQVAVAQSEKADDVAGKPRGVGLGVVTSPLDKLSLPEWAKGWSHAVFVDSEGVSDGEKFTESKIGQALADLPDLPEGSRVGLCLRGVDKKDLHLYINDEYEGQVPCEKLLDTYHFMFELRDPNKQITLKVKPLVSERGEASNPQVAVAKSTAGRPPQPRGFQFHDIHKRNAELSDDKTTAIRSTEGESDGIVISDEPMKSSMLYTVKIKKKRANERTCTLFVGVVTLPTEGPEGTEAPDSADDWPDAVVFKPGEVTVRGVPRDGLWGRELSHLTEHSEVGIGKDNAGHIYLKINRCWFRPPIDLPEGPYHAMFCMKSGCESIETCGLIKLPTGQRQ